MHRLIATALERTALLDEPAILDRLGRPLVILSAPRSGSTVLFKELRGVAGATSIGGESHGIFQAFPGLQAGKGVAGSGRLDERHAVPELLDRMRRAFVLLRRDSCGRPVPPEEPGGNLVEKTPRNILSIPFVAKLFPDCRFLVLYRRPEATIASLVEAWTAGLQTGRFVTARGLPGWDRPAWCFALPPGWQALAGRSLVEVAAFQWAACYRYLLDDLAPISPQRIAAVRFEDLLARPADVLARIVRFAELGTADDVSTPGQLPLSPTALSDPQPDKWRRLESELADAAEHYRAVAGRAEEWLGALHASAPSDRA